MILPGHDSAFAIPAEVLPAVYAIRVLLRCYALFPPGGAPGGRSASSRPLGFGKMARILSGRKLHLSTALTGQAGGLGPSFPGRCPGLAGLRAFGALVEVLSPHSALDRERRVPVR
jgi:hypothetical protein